jgi:hypothetical protein
VFKRKPPLGKDKAMKMISYGAFNRVRDDAPAHEFIDELHTIQANPTPYQKGEIHKFKMKKQHRSSTVQDAKPLKISRPKKT